jgi:hypothetical protein
MKLKRLVVGAQGTIFAKDEDTFRPCTPEELRKVADTYNAVAEAAEGSNHLPYQMTFQLLKEETIAEPVV